MFFFNGSCLSMMLLSASRSHCLAVFGRQIRNNEQLEQLIFLDDIAGLFLDTTDCILILTPLHFSLYLILRTEAERDMNI